MMVVRGTVSTAFTGAGLAIGDVRIFPADRCIWEQVDDSTGGYSIDNAAFVGLTHNIGGSPATGGFVMFSSATLGYIGKSGRFVAISN